MYVLCVEMTMTCFSQFFVNVFCSCNIQNFHAKDPSIVNKTCISSSLFQTVFFFFFAVWGYWIGGYNFHNDYDMEWVGQPNQVMPFSDMGANQPNYPWTELCMVMWTDLGFQWADYSCHNRLSYICEFIHR